MMERFKTGLLPALLSLVALNAHADRLYIENTSVQAGSTCELNIVLESGDMSQYCAFQFDLALPQGFETNRENMGYYMAHYSEDQTLDVRQLGNGIWRVVSLSPTNNRLKGQTGAIMQIKATTSGTLSGGSYNGSLQNIAFTRLRADGSTETVRMAASTFMVSVRQTASLAFNSVTKTYGDAPFQVQPAKNTSGGAITYSSDNTSVVTISGQTFTIVGTGSATITANQAATAAYEAASATFTVTVNRREAVLSWSNLSFTYDGNSHVPTANVTNLIGNDACIVTVIGAQTNVGSYFATATALSNPNYKLPAANTQAFTITSASSTLTFDPINKTYGDAAFTVSPKTNVSGGAISYSASNTSVVMVSGQTFTIVGAGTTVITANQAATANYGATSTTFSISVDKAPLTITAINYTRKVGEPNPEFCASYSGFKYGETEAVLSRQPQFLCDATPSSPANTYPIHVYGAEAKNYNISYVNGILTVEPSAPVNIPGDLNGDNLVNGTDLVVMISMIMEQQDKTDAADLNNDGLVNGTDLVALIEKVLNATK